MDNAALVCPVERFCSINFLSLFASRATYLQRHVATWSFADVDTVVARA
jgi:hypothetical protein